MAAHEIAQHDRGSPHWTKEPEKAEYSDWTVEITCETSKKWSCYSVHRYVLGFRSFYFNRVFGTGGFAESAEQKSKIILPDTAAEAFEEMLDYCYLSGNKLNIETTNAAGLLFLSDYFQITALKTCIEKFLDNDLQQDTCVMYFQHARDMHIQCLMDCVALFCHNNPSSLKKGSPLWEIANADLWKAVLKAKPLYSDFWEAVLKPSPKRVYCEWSWLLALFLKKYVVYDEWGDIHVFNFDRHTFQELTDREILPIISTKAAMTYLVLESCLQPCGLRCCDECTTVVANPEEAEVTSLQKRCVASLTGVSWEGLQLTEFGSRYLRRISRVVLESLLLSAVEHIQLNGIKK
jgi:BTB/POZ domain